MSNIINITTQNQDTGEFVSNQIVEGEYRVKLVSEKSIAAFKLLRNGNLDIHTGEAYTKSYENKVVYALQNENFTPNELRLWIALSAHFVKYKTGELLERDMSPTNAAQLLESAGIEQRRGYSAINSFIKKGILKRERRGKGFVYYVNPFIFQRGNSIDLELFDKFKDTAYAKIPLD